jgi:hypothetical protein
MTRALPVALICLALAAAAGCRRENPAPPRTATAAAVQAASRQATAVVATATAVVEATAVAAAGPSAARMGKVISGGLGVTAGIQIWSKPGGVLAGGATMAGILPDGAAVEVVRSDEFLGQRYHQVRGTGGESGKEGWVEARFVQLQ